MLRLGLGVASDDVVIHQKRNRPQCVPAGNGRHRLETCHPPGPTPVRRDQQDSVRHDPGGHPVDSTDAERP